ncbi:60S ribosomal protein L10, putative [Brugia malayi]|uniref:60S ribosomal protein L10, putative n=1 Tax=Brugia malayi TaxID=6279 RepID=A0A4E9FTG5_BRUMA|nr:60S ribosomal protein L10, putative [Brugia malayi]VIP00062.1 60S ribosomal protein L10, putative [Brugia malayi]
MLSCAGADRLETGMRGDFGKPQDLVVRIDIGDILISVRVKEQHEEHAVEAFRRAKFKFPGVSLLWYQRSGALQSGTKGNMRQCVKDVWYQIVQRANSYESMIHYQNGFLILLKS